MEPGGLRKPELLCVECHAGGWTSGTCPVLPGRLRVGKRLKQHRSCARRGPRMHAAPGAPRLAPDRMLRGSPGRTGEETASGGRLGSEPGLLLLCGQRRGPGWSPGLAVLMTRVMSLQRHRRLFVMQDSLLTLGLRRCPRNSISSVVCVSDDRVIMTYSKGHQCGDNKTASAVIELTCAKTVGRPSFTR